jgi:hypothetical protein
MNENAAEAERLVDLCRRPGREWLRAMRKAQKQLERAVDGRSWRVDVEMVGVCTTRLGFLWDGVVAVVEEGDPVDARIAGDPIQVAEFALGRTGLEKAVAEGVLRPAEGISLDILAQIRAVVSTQLRQLVAAPAAVALFSWRLGWRLQRWRVLRAAEVLGALERMAPVIAAAAAAVAFSLPAQPQLDRLSVEAQSLSEPSHSSSLDRGGSASLGGPVEPAPVTAHSARAPTSADPGSRGPIGPIGSDAREASIAAVAVEVDVHTSSPAGASTEHLGVTTSEFEAGTDVNCEHTHGAALCDAIRLLQATTRAP